MKVLSMHFGAFCYAIDWLGKMPRLVRHRNPNPIYSVFSARHDKVALFYSPPGNEEPLRITLR
jgi:hypothetical protein